MDTLALTSVFLGIVSVLQGVNSEKNGESCENNMHLIHEQLTRIDVFYKHLTLSKAAHDQFQMLELSIDPHITPLINASSSELNNQDKHNHVGIIIDTSEHFIRLSMQNLFEPTQSNEKVMYPKNLNLTEEVKLCLEAINIGYPEFYNSVEKHFKNVDELKSYHSKKDYGYNYERFISTYVDTIKRVLGIADKLIINTIPVLDLFHSLIKNKIMKIS